MMKRLSFWVAAGLALAGCQPDHQQADNSAWQADNPVQYESWSSTEQNTKQSDQLAARPAMVVLWAGSGFSKDYNSPRGHQFAVGDVVRTLRTGAPKEGEKQKSASCWTCKSPDVPRLMNEMGEAQFAASGFFDVGPEMANSIGCHDCHEADSNDLRIARPHAQKAMDKVQLGFETQDRNMQGAQTCGQCHVTYYFQPEAHNKVNIPWIFGSTADDIEKYYDTRRFYEWLHPISQTPMLKARHPDFETWSRSAHAKQGVTCVTCHMPVKTGEDGKEYTEHNVGKGLANFKLACAGCHDDQGALAKALAQNKQAISKARSEVENLLALAHFDARAAWDAGASWDQMDGPIMDIRHSQWRWDFAVASHGIHAHNPEEGLALLAVAKTQAEAARSKLAALHQELGVEDVAYPDLSSKASVQKAVGIAMEQDSEAKRAFLRSQVEAFWPEAAKRGAPPEEE